MDTNVESEVGSESQPKLTCKQAKFAAAYMDPAAANGNGTLAAKLAGYRGDNKQLAVQASDNLRNPKIQQVISAALDAMIAHALDRVREALDATKSRSFLDKAGNVLTTDPEPDHKMRLQAAEFVFEQRGKCSRASDQMGDGSSDLAAIQGKDLDPADRALLSQASQIEAELAEIDRELDEHVGDHATVSSSSPNASAVVVAAPEAREREATPAAATKGAVGGQTELEALNTAADS